MRDDDITPGGSLVSGPHGTFTVAQGTRRRFSGWVVSRTGAASEDDPVYDFRHQALIAARILAGR